MEDFTSFKYPKTTYNAPTDFQSHADYLQAATLRHKIANALHGLSMHELSSIHSMLQVVKAGSIAQNQAPT